MSIKKDRADYSFHCPNSESKNRLKEKLLLARGILKTNTFNAIMAGLEMVINSYITGWPSSDRQ